MTAERIRDLGYIAWENDLAWMETMQGRKWKSLLRQEKHIWNTLIDTPKIKNTSRKFLKEFEEDVVPYVDIHDAFIIGNGAISITVKRGSSIEWRWVFSKGKGARYASDLDTDGTHVWYTTSEEDVHYKYSLTCERADGVALWRKKEISTEVCVIDNLCYFIRLNYPFETSELCVCDALTGRNERIIYKESDPRRFIELILGPNRTLFCKSITWNESRLWLVRGHTLIRQHAKTRLQIPLDADNALIIRENSTDIEQFGPAATKWIMPSRTHYPVWANIQTGHLLTMNNGEQVLWYCAQGKRPIRIYSIIAGDFIPNMWARWHGVQQQDFIIRDPSAIGGSPARILRVLGRAPVAIISPFKSPPRLPQLKALRYTTKSADGTHVSYLLVHSAEAAPTKLLAYVYGAYGSPTLVTWPYMGWLPLLTRGWAIAYAFVRGGGDRDFAWTDAGQRENHIRTIEDFEAIVMHARTMLSIPSSRTAIYGRSAGGMVVGSTTARNPDGRLMGATFTEVPFVDILRTQTNPNIPLTQSGYTEYGNPIKSLTNFEAMLTISPMNALPQDGAPGLFVICRTGLQDLQVLPFEPFKWIQRLRGGRDIPAGKYLSFEPDEAHVYSQKKMYDARATDLAVLDSWAEGKLPAATF